VPAARVGCTSRRTGLKIVCPVCGYTIGTTWFWVRKQLSVCPCGAAMKIRPEQRRGVRLVRPSSVKAEPLEPEAPDAEPPEGEGKG
jgi:hypothetical protein